MKQYIQPQAEIISAEETSFICGSGPLSGIIPNGQKTSQPKPKPETGSYALNGEAKEYDSAIDWNNEDWDIENWDMD